MQSLVADLHSQLARDGQGSSRAVRDVVLDPRVAENTLVRLVNKLIIEARAQGASDIHIESNRDEPTRIRFRKDGDLEDYLELPPAYNAALVSRLKVMAELDISEHRQPRTAASSSASTGRSTSSCASPSSRRPTVSRTWCCGSSAAQAAATRTRRVLAERSRAAARHDSRSVGLFLVCGPTGSGKTTTLHSLLQEINRPDLKIWTAEDPIEIVQPGLRQVQVHAKIDWTFAAAMRTLLRADPDVIMVGEMRDAETTKIGIEASLTGHLVLSTLHTNSAPESIVRLLDLGMDPFNFADALIGVLAQRLTRKLCVVCRRPRTPNPTELTDLAHEYCSGTKLDPIEVLAGWQREYAHQGELRLFEAAGCDHCRHGYKGRIVVYELLPASADIKHLVRTRATVPEVAALAQRDGMVSLRQHAIQKVLQCVLDIASARAVAN